MLGAEETWVDDPRDAWHMQGNVEYLHAASFLTQAHDLHRIRWMLLDPRDAKVSGEVAKFLVALAGAAKLPHGELVALAGALAGGELAAREPKKYLDLARKLSPSARALAHEAGKDLAAIVPSLPDSSLVRDWEYLCKQMAHDLKIGAPAALARLADVRARIVRKIDARVVVVGSTTNRAAIASELDGLLHAVPPGVDNDHIGTLQSPPPLRSRLIQRGEKGSLQFLGLVNPATSGGVFLNLAPSTTYTDSDDGKLLDYLASNLMTGHGAHSMFMKTWAAGLAYSNGLHPHLGDGTLDYYAERCPLLPQTLRFVIDELRKAKPDPDLARYALAIAFTSRLANGYEARAGAMAADLVDGLTPDVVRAFRARLLELAKRPDLPAALFARVQGVYAKVLPGLGKLDPDGEYFVIGPDKQLAAYEEYLRSAVGKDATLVRIYPRDFWLVVENP
jgi:hypothetical protein